VIVRSTQVIVRSTLGEGAGPGLSRFRTHSAYLSFAKTPSATRWLISRL
jgi:hypothetical protein